MRCFSFLSIMNISQLLRGEDYHAATAGLNVYTKYPDVVCDGNEIPIFVYSKVDKTPFTYTDFYGTQLLAKLVMESEILFSSEKQTCLVEIDVPESQCKPATAIHMEQCVWYIPVIRADWVRAVYLLSGIYGYSLPLVTCMYRSTDEVAMPNGFNPMQHGRLNTYVRNDPDMKTLFKYVDELPGSGELSDVYKLSQGMDSWRRDRATENQ